MGDGIRNNILLKATLLTEGIGQIGGDDCWFFCFQNYCANFKDNREFLLTSCSVIVLIFLRIEILMKSF